MIVLLLGIIAFIMLLERIAFGIAVAVVLPYLLYQIIKGIYLGITTMPKKTQAVPEPINPWAEYEQANPTHRYNIHTGELTTYGRSQQGAV